MQIIFALSLIIKTTVMKQKKFEYLFDIYFKKGEVLRDCSSTIMVDEDKDPELAILEEISIWNTMNYDKEEKREFKGFKY
jgi:hypothetical protein